MKKKSIAYRVLRTGSNLFLLAGLLLVTFGLGGAAGEFLLDIQQNSPGRANSTARFQPVLAAQVQTEPDGLAKAPKIPVRVADLERLPTVAPKLQPGIERVESGPIPTASPTPEPPAVPDRIVIPAIGLDAPVVLAPVGWVEVDGSTYQQWLPPEFFAAGWHEGSANPGLPGNTVISGHHNIYDSVFARLSELKEGDVIALYSGERFFGYFVSQVLLLEENSADLNKRLENSLWIRPSDDERLTLVSCWPPESNTYRVIVVAIPE